MSELIDLVNESGEIVERGVPRDDAERREGSYMQIVITVIFNSMEHVLAHERAASKEVDNGKVDHVCGGLRSGETPESGAIREAQEEVGVTPKDLKIIRRGVNEYGRYCYLLTGESDEEPVGNPEEATWARYYDPEELRKAREARTLEFVDGFFKDLELATLELEN